MFFYWWTCDIVCNKVRNGVLFWASISSFTRKTKVKISCKRASLGLLWKFSSKSNVQWEEYSIISKDRKYCHRLYFGHTTTTARWKYIPREIGLDPERVPLVRVNMLQRQVHIGANAAHRLLSVQKEYFLFCYEKQASTTCMKRYRLTDRFFIPELQIKTGFAGQVFVMADSYWLS